MIVQRFGGLPLRLFHVSAFPAICSLVLLPLAQAQKITVYDVPGSTGTYLSGINDSGTVIGYYATSSSMGHGFVISHGKFTPIDASGDIVGTFPCCINAYGVIAGTYQQTASLTLPWISGFVRSIDGSITTFNAPGNFATQVFAINAYGAITGSGASNCPGGDGSECGFIRDPQGNITNFAPPDNLFTYGWGFGPGGIIVSNYTNFPALIQSAIVRRPDGTLQTIAFPNETNTALIGMTPTGLMVGDYGNENATDQVHGFLMNPAGQVLPFDFPGSAYTIPVAINPSGVVIGTYYSAVFTRPHGFIRGPKGNFLAIVPPNSTSVSPTGINSSAVVVGNFIDANGATHGFVWQPTSNEAIGNQ